MRIDFHRFILLIGFLGVGLLPQATARQEQTPPSPGQAESPEDLAAQRKAALEQIQAMLRGNQLLTGLQDADDGDEDFPFSLERLLDMLAPTQPEPVAGPPFVLDNVQGEWVNLEPQLIKPILVTQDEQFVVVANEPDDRLVVFTPNLGTIIAEIVLGQGIAALAERPAMSEDAPHEIWVSVRNQSAVMVIDESTWRVSHVLRAPIAGVTSAARDADHPGGIAFNASGTKAYVAAASTDALVVFDAAAKTWLSNIALRRPHNQMVPDPAMNEPYAVVSDGDNTIYVISQISGNQSAVAGPPLNTIAKLATPPLQNFSLPDFDIMAVDTNTDAVVNHYTNIGTVLLGVAIHPTSGELIVSNMESRNADFLGEHAFPNGQVTFNRLTFQTPSTLPPPPPPIFVSTDRTLPLTSVVMPTDIAIDALGRVFVAGYASSNIGVVTNVAGGWGLRGTLATQAGPRGLAVARNAGVLYCLNHAENSVWAFDVSLPALPTLPLYKASLTDPTFDRVKLGRKQFLDPMNSGTGTTGCFSCHHDARKDGLTWNLSKYFDPGSGFTFGSPPTMMQDNKGQMVTQDLRSLADIPGYHWRGEQQDLEDFNPAFVGLLHGQKLSAANFALLKDYLFSAVYPPNPFQQLDRNFSPAALVGANNFSTLNSDGTMMGPRTCRDCHSLPIGSDASITDFNPLIIKTTQLRGMWTKASSLANADNLNPPPNPVPLGSLSVLPMTGTGFFHTGFVDSVAEFVNLFFGGLQQSERDDIITFMDEFDSGLAPATMYSELVNSSTIGQSLVGSYLISQANAGNCDIAAHGRIRISGVWREVGLVFRITGQNFVPDLSSLGTFSWPQIQSLATAGDAELLFLGVPVWSGERIGVDRDRDGIFDGNERVMLLDPKNPDTDNDGMWDGYDPQPLRNPNTILPVGAPTVSNISVVFVTTNSIKVTYQTSALSPTRVEYGLTTAYGQVAGDPYPLPLNPPAARSNLWKRKHTAFLRPLQDGKTYHFRIRTQGQNNALGATGNMSTVSETDDTNPNMRVGSVALTATPPSPVNYTATVTIVDNIGNVVSGATVTARWTHYVTGATLPSQTVQQVTTNALGVASFSTSDSSQVTGDRTVFDIPMIIVVGGNVVAGVSHPTLTLAWPEGFGTETGHNATEILVP
jgi:DNA-binding beta-propeller fold protein YncE